MQVVWHVPQLLWHREKTYVTMQMQHSCGQMMTDEDDNDDDDDGDDKGDDDYRIQKENTM